MALHNDLGKIGEDVAAAYLIRNGYRIRHRNWRSRRYELDIVAVKDRQIVFVEVKTRRNTDYGGPEEAVTRLKIRHIVSCASSYMRCYNLDLDFRFDVITVVGTAKPFQIEHIENAFDPC